MKSFMKILLKFTVAICLFSLSWADQEKYIIRQTPSISSPTFILMDADTGLVLAERCADCKVQPASITKLMPLYILSDALQKKKINSNDLVPISKAAASLKGSRMFVNPGSNVSVNELMNGIIVSSGNDATFAISEYLGGNESSFIEIMNDTANKLGMTNTHFSTSTGLPNDDQYSTARDLATLSRELVTKFPEYYPKYSQKTFEFNKIKQNNRNHLLWADDRVDGMKTGYTDKAGYCLVSSAKYKDMRLISVVLGAKTELARKHDSLNLLNYGFRFYKTKHMDSKLIKKVPVWYGSSYAKVGLAESVNVVVPRFNDEDVKVGVKINSPLFSPINKGAPIGKLILTYNSTVLSEYPLVALDDVKNKFYPLQIFDYFSLHWHNLWGSNKA